MSVKLEFGILADTASLDASGKLSLLGEFNAINATAYPATHPMMAIVAKFTQPTEDIDSAEQEVGIEISSPADAALISKDVKATVVWRQVGPLMPGVSECRLLISMTGLRLPEPGVYRIRFLMNSQEVASIPFLGQQVTVG